MDNRASRTKQSQDMAEIRRYMESQKEKSPPVVRYLRSGLVLGVIGLATSFAGQPELFWVVVVCVFMGFVAAALDPWFEQSLHDKFAFKIVVTISMILAGSAFAYWIAFYPAPLSRKWEAFDGHYKAGEDVYGITWKDGMSELRVNIYNPSDREYEKLDLTIKPGDPFMGFRGQAQITNIPFCTITPISNVDMHLNMKDPTSGDVHERNVKSSMVAEERILCDRLPSQTSARFVMGVSGLRPEFIYKGGSPNSPSGMLLLGTDDESQGLFAQVMRSVAVNGKYLSTIAHPHVVNGIESVDQR